MTFIVPLGAEAAAGRETELTAKKADHWFCLETVRDKVASGCVLGREHSFDPDIVVSF